ncbi:DUF1501 domain-containing protein [Dyadobacter crusticola]|uniref:DUF1501 domain-containing protein n=1 Tax=Dyadobacter crusticola TaxID=292407 RepID=UPI000A6D0E1B|nr:DUF1501 domain-containing protein [Dyadobacter crusticola]
MSTINRRDFLAATSSMVLPVMLNGFGVKAFARNSALVNSLHEAATANPDRVLVIIYLNGGNDGLNMVIPVEHYSRYQSLRSNIAIPENKVLTLGSSKEMGLHPAMTGMQQLYKEGKLAIVHSVSYPNPNLSHIRSTDIYMTGSDATQYASTGWAGRYLEDRFPGYPENYPNDNMKDPLAIQIGHIASTSLLGKRQSMGIVMATPDEFYQLVGTQTNIPVDDLPCCYSGQLIKYVREQQVLSIGYGAQIKRASEAGRNMASYPENGNELAEQLKIVARLIHGGLQSKIYYVELGGFDLHSEQVDPNDTSNGAHASLLSKLSGAVSAFQQDLKLQGTEDRVIGMTFSDFGRRASSNASKGTDHGIAAPMLVFGTGIKRQNIGTNPDLAKDLVPPLASSGDNNYDIAMQIDFRRVYSDILSNWFGAESPKTDAVLFKSFKNVSLFSNIVETIGSGSWGEKSIWSHGRVPDSNDLVKINRGHTISVSQNIAAKKINVDSGGELYFQGNYKVDTRE